MDLQAFVGTKIWRVKVGLLIETISDNSDNF